MVALLHYININCLPMKLIERLDLQPLEKCVVRRGNMDIELIHVNPIDAEVSARLGMGLCRPVENRDSCRRIPMNQLSLVCRRLDSGP
jgi:hypothetical protein